MTDTPAPEPTDNALVAQGGWCAPSMDLYSLITGDPDLITIPESRLYRPGTPEYDKHQARVAAQTAAREETRRAALEALPPAPDPVSHVWVAYQDQSYEGDTVVAVTTTALGALAACERHSLANRYRSGPVTWETEHANPDATYLEGWAGGDRYFITREDLLP